MHEEFPQRGLRGLRGLRGGVVLCLLLWGMAFPMSAQAATHSTKYLVPVGHTIGIKLFARGVLVVDSGTAKDSGIRVGDMLLQCNGTAIQSIEQFSDLLQKSGGTVSLTLRRGNRTLELPVPVTEGADGVWRLGAWIRDSMAGIGTMTFYDPETGVFGALGHGVTDTDTALLMPLSAGAIMESTVKAVKRGEEGCAGELRGDFNLTEDMGTLSANSDCGVFGQMERENWSGELGEALPIAAPGEVKTGKATILANVTGDTVEEYGVEISRVYPAGGDTRNLLVTVTDPRLLETTGGIVQGMSGSPILQDGKLVGAVTHVLLNDPTRGYGILIQSMMRQAYGDTGEQVS